MLGYGIMPPLLPFFVQAQDGGAAIAGGLMSMYSTIQPGLGPIRRTSPTVTGANPFCCSVFLGTATSYLCSDWQNSLIIIFLAVFIDGLTGSNLLTRSCLRCIHD
ncbi:MAG: hypothetical protein IPG44_11660 [Anaerolineales bacterium]|nr:hypothetical protein [Anaerolineales bacterium]